MQLNPDRGCWICAYCESEWAPEATADGIRVLAASDLDCPVCRVKLSQARLIDYALFYCESCQGTLVRMADLMPLTDDLRASRGSPAYIGRPPDPKSLDRRIACPRCHRSMDTHAYCGPGNVVIDTCESCELHWLDRGELRRIASAPDYHYQS